MAGKYVYTLSSNDNFQATDEANLRLLIMSGAFNSVGRVRMVPRNAHSTIDGSALSVVSYMGKALT